MSNNILDLPEKELIIEPYKPESWRQDRGLLQGEHMGTATSQTWLRGYDV